MVHDYITVYLPHHKSASEHTIRAYRKALDVFFDYLKASHNVSLFELSFEMIDHSAVMNYQCYLKDDKKCSDATCAHRLACVKAFLRYCSEADTSLTKYYLSTEGVCSSNVQSVHEIDYLSEKAVRLLIEQPDGNTRKGRRDRFFMILLYDTGARVDELLNVRICDVKAEDTATVLLYGKGKKYRRVPPSSRTVGHYTKYLSEFHPDENEYSQNYLFYSVRGSEHGKMSSNNVRVFMTAYGLEARKYCPEIPENVHPHLFRHSRAMHLYQGGMDLTLVSQWLGHANLQTTFVYAHADTEQKRAAIELATGAGNPT